MSKETKVPTNLKHTPIYAINNYDAVDGNYKNNTDVVGLSIGKAQWKSDEFIPSVKVWRKPNNRWSRQSEETTITRALDMAMLVINVLNNYYNGADFQKIQSIYGTLEIDKMNCDPSIVRDFYDFLDKYREDIEQHINILYDVISVYKRCQENNAHNQVAVL